MSEEEERGGVIYNVGVRTIREYALTESELDMLKWMPWFVRRRLIDRIKAETTFED